MCFVSSLALHSCVNSANESFSIIFLNPFFLPFNTGQEFFLEYLWKMSSSKELLTLSVKKPLINTGVNYKAISQQSREFHGIDAS